MRARPGFIKQAHCAIIERQATQRRGGRCSKIALAIRTENLRKVYGHDAEGRDVGLLGLSLEVEQGQIFGLVGPNGSGKTTLLEVLLGLLPVASGTVRILGQLPGETDAIAYVPQDYTAAAGSALRARDMVALGLTGTSWGFRRTTAAQWKRIEDTMRAVDAFEVIDQRLATLSGGQRQRVAIAQALVSEPKLLLLDEPLANLDLRNQREVISLLDRLNSTLGVTIIMVAHDLNPLLRVLDGAVYLLDGHAHYDTLNGVVDDALLTHLYGTPLHVVRTVQGDLFVRGE